MLVVGDDLELDAPGNRITIGDDSGPSGINLGEDTNHRAFILWQRNNDYLELGTRAGGVIHGNNLVVRQGNVGISDNRPSEKLTVNGNVLADDFLTPSSIKLKTNIKAIEGALATVQSLRGVAYDWKDSGEHDIGLIAEEVGKVLPEIVIYEENGIDAKALDYSRLVPVLIEAMKEQQQILDEQGAQIAAVQADNHQLEARLAALEEAISGETDGTQTGDLLYSDFMMWLLAGGLGLLLASLGLVLGYRRTRQN
jgi:hypothetical protein